MIPYRIRAATKPPTVPRRFAPFSPAAIHDQILSFGRSAGEIFFLGKRTHFSQLCRAYCATSAKHPRSVSPVLGEAAKHPSVLFPSSAVQHTASPRHVFCQTNPFFTAAQHPRSVSRALCEAAKRLACLLRGRAASCRSRRAAAVAVLSVARGRCTRRAASPRNCFSCKRTHFSQLCNVCEASCCSRRVGRSERLCRIHPEV